MAHLEFIECQFEDDCFRDVFRKQIVEDLCLPLPEIHPLVTNQYDIYVNGTKELFPSAKPFLISSGNEKAGVLIWDSDKHHIVYLMILPEFRRKGIASKAINQLIKNREVTLNVLKTNSPAISLYKSMDFNIVSDFSTHWLMKFEVS